MSDFDIAANRRQLRDRDARIDASMLTRYGVRPVYGGACCPRRIVGRRCLGWPDCLCMRYQGTQLLDHVGFWRGADGRRVFTAQPYGAAVHHAGRLAAFEVDCAILGLTVTVDPDAPYAPGDAILILVSHGPLTGAPS